jgi:hypothetical protein
MAGRSAAGGAILLVLAATALMASAPAGATRSGQICPAFRSLKLKVQWETVGEGYTCTSAKPWVLKLIADKVKKSPGNVPLRNGPKGLHCFATLETKGHASVGVCYKGTLAYPGSGFTWNGT